MVHSWDKEQLAAEAWHMSAVVIVHQLGHEADVVQFSGNSVASVSKSFGEEARECCPHPILSHSSGRCPGEGHLRGGGGVKKEQLLRFPMEWTWPGLLWWDLEPRFGDTEVPPPGSFCRLEGDVRGGPAAFILLFL